MDKEAILSEMLQNFWKTYKGFHPDAWCFCLSIIDSTVDKASKFEYWDAGHYSARKQITVKENENG